MSSFDSPRHTHATEPLRDRARSLCRLIYVLLVCLGLPSRSAAQEAVISTTSDRELSWRFAHSWTIGGAHDEIVSFSTFRAKDVAIADGRLYVLDRDGSRVLVLDNGGSLIGTLGRRGRGPGEFQFPTSIATDTRGRVLVEDASRARLVVFGADGRVVEERIHDPSSAQRELRVLANGSLIGIRATGRMQQLVRTRGVERAVLLEVRIASKHHTEPVCDTPGYPVSTIFAPRVVWTTAGDITFASDGGPHIHLLAGDSITRTIGRRLEPRIGTPALARAHIGRGIRIRFEGQKPCLVPAELILEVAEIARDIPVYSALAVDPEGRIWATRFPIADEDGIADLFDQRNGYIGTVRLGRARPIGFLSDGNLLSLETDGDEVPLLRSYDIHRRNPTTVTPRGTPRGASVP